MKIVAIGGGEIGRAGTCYQTKEIDEEIVKLTSKEKPKFLFIGLASSFADSYYKVIKDIYKNLGCETGKISNKTLTHMEVVETKIKEADIIYVGGGDTSKLMSIVRETKMDVMLKEAMERGSVMAGISAGAIIWCKKGLSDYQIMNNISDNYASIDGLGFIDYMFIPHFSSDPKKEIDLKNIIEKTNINCLCVDNCAAIEVIDNDVKIIKTDENAKGYFVSYKKEYKKEEIK